MRKCLHLVNIYHVANQGDRIGDKLGQFAPNLRLFKISFSTFWLGEPKCTETDLKKSQMKSDLK